MSFILKEILKLIPYILFNLYDKLLYPHPIYSQYLCISKSILSFKHKTNKKDKEKKRLTNKMGSKAVVSVYLIISLCAAIFVTRGVAQMQNPQAIPGLFPPGLVPIDLVKCWSSLFTVQGCVLAISNSFFFWKI